MERAGNQAKEPEVGSGLSGKNTSPSPYDNGGRRENITRIDRKLYKAAVEGNFEEFIHVQNIESLLTPNKNTILHIHLTSQIPENVSEQFVEQVLERCGGLVGLPNAKGETPLHVAAKYGHSRVAKLLILRAANACSHDIESGIGGDKKLIRATDCENDTALHEAVRYNHSEVVKILGEMDPDHSYSANKADETPLYLASERQHKRMVRKMLQILKSPTYDGPSGRTALHAAVINRDIEMARDLLKNDHLRASVKHADKIGWVPLHYAVEIGDKHLTELLLEQDENTAYMQDNNGRTALHIAASCDNRIMKMILEYYPDCSEIVDNNGWNALHHAVNMSNFFSVHSIVNNLSLSNLYNEKDLQGNTPLHHLAASPCTSFEVNNPRVDKNAINKDEKTALDVAWAMEGSDRNHLRQALMHDLVTNGARRSQRLDLNSKNKQGNSQQFTKSANETHLLVATLIATVSFAAGFTLPGGTIQDGELQGKPILGQRASFKAFIVSNTIALVLSASATFIHLFSPLNKAKWKDSYLSQIAFSFILVAVAAVVIAFSTGTYAVLGSSSTGIAVLITGLSFFIFFFRVLRLCFPSFLSTFIKNIVNVILFAFFNVSATEVGLLFCKSKILKIDHGRAKSRITF